MAFARNSSLIPKYHVFMDDSRGAGSLGNADDGNADRPLGNDVLYSVDHYSTEPLLSRRGGDGPRHSTPLWPIATPAYEGCVLEQPCTVQGGPGAADDGAVPVAHLFHPNALIASPGGPSPVYTTPCTEGFRNPNVLGYSSHAGAITSSSTREETYLSRAQHCGEQQVAATPGFVTPATDWRSSLSAISRPGSSVRSASGSGRRTPGSRLRAPWSGFKSSGSGLRTPGSLLKTPRLGLQRFGSEIRTPELDLRTPRSKLNTPRSAHTPRFGLRTFGSGLNTPRFGLDTPGSERTPGGSARTVGSAQRYDEHGAPSTIVALVEGRGQSRGSVGLAALELRQPVLRLAQFTDTHTCARTLAMLAILDPVEVLLPSTGADSGVSRMVQESVSGACISTVHRRYYHEGRGLAVVKHLASELDANTVVLRLAGKYYCLAAAAALMRYVEHVQNTTYVAGSLRLIYTSSENTLMIDHSSCRQLELVRCLDGGWRQSLFGVLRNTRTPAGTRLLRATLLQPHASLDIIQARQDALQYLVEHQNLFSSLQSLLGRFPDLDWLLSMCAQQHKEDSDHRCEQRLNYVIGLKNTVELLPVLATALHGVTNPLLDSLRQSLFCPGVSGVSGIVSSVIHEDARLLKGGTAMRTQRCYAIKSNINGLLDVARKIYSEIIDDITSHVKEICEEHRLNARVGHNTARGFHIIVPLHPEQRGRLQLPSVLLQVQRGRRSYSCTTELLYQLDQRSRDTMREILIMSNVIVGEVINEVRCRVSALHSVAEVIAAVDLLTALAAAAAQGGWVRPQLTSAGGLRVVRGRHAILDLLNSVPPVANNTELMEDQRAMLVTGPNMSGKSTYLRQVALIQILAQMGSFVPAESATLQLRDQLFAMLGPHDSPENNASTFQMQMLEVSSILQHSSRSTLVLLDELAAGTHAPEAAGLAWAVTEALLLAGPAVVVATHFSSLTRMAGLYPQIRNYYFATSAAEGGRHCLREGVTPVKHYGLAAAALSALPADMLEHARNIADTISPSEQAAAAVPVDMLRECAVQRLALRLMFLADDACTYLAPPSLPHQKKVEGVDGGTDASGGGGCTGDDDNTRGAVEDAGHTSGRENDGCHRRSNNICIGMSDIDSDHRVDSGEYHADGENNEGLGNDAEEGRDVDDEESQTNTDTVQNINDNDRSAHEILPEVNVGNQAVADSILMPILNVESAFQSNTPNNDSAPEERQAGHSRNCDVDNEENQEADSNLIRVENNCHRCLDDNLGHSNSISLDGSRSSSFHSLDSTPLVVQNNSDTRTAAPMTTINKPNDEEEKLKHLLENLLQNFLHEIASLKK